MPRVPVPLTWKRRQFAVLEPDGLVRDRRNALAVSGLVAGPFAIYGSPHGGNGPHTLIHLPSQTKIVDLPMQASCKDAAEQFAALDVNWWTCIPEEVIGPDTQEMRNVYARVKPQTWLKRPPARIGDAA